MGHKDFGVRVEIPNEPETVTIEHDQWGRMEGVTPAYENWGKEPHCWFKAGADYPKKYGWREVKPTRWVPVPIDMSIEAGRHVLRCDRSCFILPQGYRWKKVEIEREVEE